MSALLPLRAAGLSLVLEGAARVDGLDLTLDHPGITVVMGPNGAGKSLFLRLLNGLVEPTSGGVTWAGRPLDLSVRRRQAMVFQKPVLLRRTVAANLDFVLSGRGAAARRDALLSRVGLSGRAHQPARQLSGGEQQRLALARALAPDPAVLLLDEPTASLDPAATRVIESLVRSVARAGVKVIFVTHDIGQARRLADDVVFLHAGRLAEHRAAPEFFARPASRAAQAYLAGHLFITSEEDTP